MRRAISAGQTAQSTTSGRKGVRKNSLPVFPLLSAGGTDGVSLLLTRATSKGRRE